MGYLDDRIRDLQDVKKLLARRKVHKESGKVEEVLTEEEFIRSFGSKVVSTRRSGRKDLVGLMIVGKHNGIWITRGSDGVRRVRAVDVVGGKAVMLERYVVLRFPESLKNVSRGLLNWVR